MALLFSFVYDAARCRKKPENSSLQKRRHRGNRRGALT
jgi:hypothetical protein